MSRYDDDRALERAEADDRPRVGEVYRDRDTGMRYRVDRVGPSDTGNGIIPSLSEPNRVTLDGVGHDGALSDELAGFAERWERVTP